MNIGPSLILNQDGDVYCEDSGKWVVSKNEYDTQEELLELVEKYMETSDYYPNLFKVDSYGNVNLVK